MGDPSTLLEESEHLNLVESGLASPDGDTGRSKLSTARGSGAADTGASGAADSGAPRDHSGGQLHKKTARSATLTSRASAAVKATLRSARKAIATTLVLTTIMTIFVIVIHQLGWIATHQKLRISE